MVGTIKFLYAGESDINTLSKQIDAILMHIDGQIGFKEGNKYYSNKDIEKLFNKYEGKFDYIRDCSDDYSSAYCYNESKTEEDVKEYEKLKLIADINKYNGAEIYKKYEINLNHDAYHFGGIDNTYEIEIIYNLNLDKENCLLKVVHTQNEYYGRNNLLNEDIGEEENVQNSITNTFESKGKFTEIASLIEEFLKELVLIENK
jgi:hypothetical protein